MRTVPTLCALSSDLAVGVIGFTLAKSDNTPSTRQEMTAVATYTATPVETRPDLNFSSQRSFSTPQTTRLTDLRDYGGRTFSGHARTGQKRSLTPKGSFSIGMERPIQGQEDGTPQSRTPIARPRSWLRRFSSSMSTSRDSSRTPTSRPGSAALSQSNGSVAFSNAGSATPMFPDTRPLPLPPNKLVKRTSSLRSANDSPSLSPGSRLPLPVFRRPATSHQRSATLQEGWPGVDPNDRMSIDGRFDDARDPHLQHYFTPKVAADEIPSGRKRSSTGIPNPIKRVYPDRKYTPLLVSARELIKPAQVEVDDGLSVDDEEVAITKVRMAPSAASSPLPVQAAQFEEASAPRRSFSIGDLLSTGPQPLWKRPTSSRSKAPASKLARMARPQVTSAPQTSMGGAFSSAARNGSERPAKRRDLTDPQAAQRSIYSSSSSIHPAGSHNQESPLNFGSTTPQSQHFSFTESPLVDNFSQAATLPPLEQRSLPSATFEDFSGAPHARVSATQSEITSTIGSDSERRSTGGYSTDYQSDTTVYDSFRTRTTRSSSGKRGPPIDTIFDESPPTYSSGRSTKLHDLLHDGVFPGSENGPRYRHSTIEEEESIVSTPVRSMHNKSVTSTPSARPGAQRIFTSSPPAVFTLPDTDEMDWDEPDNVPSTNQGLGIERPNAVPAGLFPRKGIPLHLGAAFPHSAGSALAHSTPSRYSNGGTDKANLFDWSEQQPSPSHQDQSPPRPRTVHGKKDPETRGSRQPGRRAPSGMHARSHSVPVVPDADGKRSVVANKFGTWGVGSKGVTEDWNEDFDFDEPPLPVPEAIHEKRIDSGREIMLVPKSIREQQENVVANISLLREWGLLIEELKDLRIRAVALDMLHGPYAHAWQEVDAMIELADQESEEDTLQPRCSPPSSPGFDFGAFEEPMPGIVNTSRSSGESVMRLAEPVFAEENDLLTIARGASPQPGLPASAFTPRPRKDSEAVARSVIEALQSKRSVSDPTALKAAPIAKKVPFDTATLRHIVPYVNSLKRKIKDALRETEGLYSSPRRRSSPDDIQDQATDVDEPAFRSIFNGPQPDSPTASRRSRRDRAVIDHDGSEEPSVDQRGDLARRLQNMSLPYS